MTINSCHIFILSLIISLSLYIADQTNLCEIKYLFFVFCNCNFILLKFSISIVVDIAILFRAVNR